LSIAALFLVFATGAALEPAIPMDRPGIGCWFWSEEEFTPRGYERFLDLHAEHATFGLLTTSLRHPVEVSEPLAREQIGKAAAYARERGMGMVLDLDVRLARAAFQAQYPDEMQELARLREIPLAASGIARLRTESLSLSDHYTFKARPYDTVSSRLLRVYSYVRGPEGIMPETVADITERCMVEESSTEALSVRVDCRPEDAGRTMCVVSAFTLFSPDVFAPHLIEFERSIMALYADAELAGACKDEWGFPGRFDPTPDDLWFSKAMAEAYAARRDSADLTADLLLMAKGMAGREGERAAAINHYMELCRSRNVEVETRFYENAKAVFGADAFVGTHATWYPWPGAREAFKNGLSWWAVPRDIAQTDETTPYAARTALAKKAGSAVWLNMYYAPDLAGYADDVWRHALGGGRMNFHPVWPSSWEGLTESLLNSDALLGDARIRLLDKITTAPIDCPVAVVFGHPAVLNWSGPEFADAGVALTDALWEQGIYADLIPSSEIADGSLTIALDGSLAYGAQRYRAAVLYHPEFERPEMAALWQRVAEGGKTATYRVGSWTRDFDGQPFDGNAALPEAMTEVDSATGVETIRQLLHASGAPLQTPCVKRELHGFEGSMVPENRGRITLLDGTMALLSGSGNPAGATIAETIEVSGHDIAVDALGLAAIRLDKDGAVEALACGGLRWFRGGGMAIDLPERRDIALWRDRNGHWQGATTEGEIPEALLAIAPHWQRLKFPTVSAPGERQSP